MRIDGYNSWRVRTTTRQEFSAEAYQDNFGEQVKPGSRKRRAASRESFLAGAAQITFYIIQTHGDAGGIELVGVLDVRG